MKSQEQTISVSEFGRKHLTPELHESYSDFMRRSKFPEHAITKDIEYIASRLKRRQKATFSSGVQITAPADKFKELIVVGNVEDGKTIITINGVIEKTE